MFEFVEASFDSVALLVEFPVIVSLQLSIAFGWDHGFCAEMLRLCYEAVGIVAAVGEHGFGTLAIEQLCRWRVFAGLSGGDTELQRKAVLIRQQMDFCAQTSSGTPQSRIFGAPFLRPVAACW